MFLCDMIELTQNSCLIPVYSVTLPCSLGRSVDCVSRPVGAWKGGGGGGSSDLGRDLTASSYDYDFGFSWSDGEDGDASSDVINDYDDNDFSFNVHNNTVISAVSHRNSNFSSGVEDDVFVSPNDLEEEEEEEVEAVKEAPPKNKESLVSVVSGDDCDNEVLINESIGGDDSCDEVVAEVKEPNKKRHDTLSLVSSKALLAEGDSCYSYIDSELLPDVWVGPEFWKPKFKRGKPAACQQAPEKVVEKKTRRKNKRTDLLSFEDFTNVDEIFDKKSGTAAQTRMIGKMSEKKLTLPGKKNCKMQDVYRSFLRKNLFYKPFLKPDKDSTEARVEYEYADDGEHLFSNENNRIGDIDGEGVGGIVINNDNNQSDCDDFNDDYAEEPVEHVDDDEDDNVEEAGSNEVFSAENLVPMPKLVQCDAIKYATVPKRLDMKKLKTTIWSMLDLEDDKVGYWRMTLINWGLL
ncbi:hypothetical protein LSTR_LSTR015718 [Laodelphax striatellus]|uniref:Condensin complex subunit 2 n=1 Tax=Laodelphax striatellus TaxID=195883 RepID=A0A482WG54_LAOST|nr:hypothetical protein LSTR_LSTR015718 [Laodelphax striatellus]